MKNTDYTTVNRRAFLEQCVTAMTGLTMVGVVAPLLQGCEIAETFGSQSNQIIVDVSSLDVDGKAVKTTINAPNGLPVVVIRQSSTTYLALSTKCTHLGCEVGLPTSGFLQCPCHGSEYELNGSIRKGPATAALQQFPSTFDAINKTLTIVFP